MGNKALSMNSLVMNTSDDGDFKLKIWITGNDPIIAEKLREGVIDLVLEVQSDINKEKEITNILVTAINNSRLTMDGLTKTFKYKNEG